MNLYVTLLHVVALLSLAGSTRGDDVTPPTGCTVTPDEDQRMDVKMAEMAIRCLADKATVDQMNGIDTLEGHKNFFRSHCDKKREIRECLNGVTHTSELCETEIGHKFFLVLRELLETVLDSGCIQDGDTLASMFMIYNISHAPSFRSDHFHDCMNTALDRLLRLIRDDIEPHSRFFIIYREVVSSKECFGDINEGDVTLMKAIESILGEVVDKMKCVHPQAETVVLCKAIDVNMPDVPRICPMKSLDEEKHPLKDTLLEGMSWCVSSTFFDEQGMTLIDTLETSWEFVVNNCKKRNVISRCSSEIATLSSVCLNETQHDAVKLADEVLQRGLSSLCVVDGGYAGGYVLYKALTEPNATVRHNVIRDCVTFAHPQEEESRFHVDAADFVRYHRELKVFKGCLVHKLRGDNRAVFDAHLFLSTVQRKMKCLEPEHGTVVLCETIDATPSTEVTACPFVGEHENEPPKYDRLVDMAILCLKACTLELDPVKKFTTLDQFRTFFKSFCHNRRAVTHCLDDIASFSEMCLSQTHQHMLTIYTDLYRSGLESGCKQDGEIFSIVMNGFIADTEHGIANDLRDTCVNTTSDQLNKHINDTEPETSVLNYRLSKSLRQCILNGASEVGTFKTVFATLTNELLTDLKCIRPDSGTVVPCESFVD